jgi:hypothetical protein
MVVAMLAPELAVFVAVLMAKVTVKPAVIPTRQPVGVRLVVLLVDGIVAVMVFVAQLLVLITMLPVPLIPPILILGHRGHRETEGQPNPKRDFTQSVHVTSPNCGGPSAAPLLNRQ